MMEEKNSKILITLGLLVVMVVLSAFIPASWFGIKPVEKKYAQLNIPSVDDFKVLATDTNNDGTPDWRNLMQKTYTEGVTLSEGSSQATNQTPTQTTKTGTQDSQSVSKEDQARLDDPNNLTASFAKNLYLATAYMKEKGITDEQTQQEMFTSILNQEAAKIVIPTYTEKDITISTTESASSIATYSAKIQEIAALGAKYNLGVGDTDTVNIYITSKSAVDLKPLATKVTQVDALIKKLLAIPVPASAVGVHINALNSLSAYRVTLDGLLHTDTDSVRGTLAARVYETTTKRLFDALYQFDVYFKAHNVTLSIQHPQERSSSRVFALYTKQ
jgi:hypothetical protein